MKSASSPAFASFSLLLMVAASPTPAPNKSTATAPTPPAAQKNPCEGPEFRQFDFWIGSWTVRTPDGKQVGTSEISPVSDGCAIREQWKGAGGNNGMSINYYDADEKRWHQDWVGGDGTILHLRGGLEGDAMVLSGTTKGVSGELMNRITWTPLREQKVKQEWSTSDDGGKSWKTSFLGIYAHEK